MSKQQFKKFRKNDYSYEDEEEQSQATRNFLDKRKEKRVDRALRTKDITALTEDEESDYPYDNIYDEMADYDSWPEEDERR
jgi:hypothetical protein